MKRSKLLVLAAVVATLVPGVGRAAPEPIAPDFDDAYEYASCRTAGVFVVQVVIPETCTAEAEADVGGTLDLVLGTRSPADETLPAPVLADGGLELWLNHDLAPVTARFLVFHFTVQIDTARAATTGTGSYADLYLSAYAGSSSTNAGNHAQLLDGTGEFAPTEIAPQQKVIGLVLGDGTSRLHKGEHYLGLSLWGNASVGARSTGSALLELDATVTSLTVEAIG